MQTCPKQTLGLRNLVNAQGAIASTLVSTDPDAEQ
jgi:hypothetical protein